MSLQTGITGWRHFSTSAVFPAQVDPIGAARISHDLNGSIYMKYVHDYTFLYLKLFNGSSNKN